MRDSAKKRTVQLFDREWNEPQRDRLGEVDLIGPPIEFVMIPRTDVGRFDHCLHIRRLDEHAPSSLCGVMWIVRPDRIDLSDYSKNVCRKCWAEASGIHGRFAR